MKKNYRIIFYGFLIWLIVFIISIVIFPLHDSHRPFFESIMPVAIAGCTVFFSIFYFRDIEKEFFKEGMIIGVVWLVINIIFDMFMFMEGPMKMSLVDYMMDIGFTYLMIPVITVGFGYIQDCRMKNE